MPKAPVTPHQRRVQVIMTTIPLMVVSGYILYKRWVLGEPQKKFVRPEDNQFAKNTQPTPNQSVVERSRE
ncbi:hypothetical protein L218DRAFT_996120 [Marasmius fiardii PR-910]|nr:hypothetical protein L218DRAFT_996120 [Marasmius fiardii PR-910]